MQTIVVVDKDVIPNPFAPQQLKITTWVNLSSIKIVRLMEALNPNFTPKRYLCNLPESYVDKGVGCGHQSNAVCIGALINWPRGLALAWLRLGSANLSTATIVRQPACGCTGVWCALTYMFKSNKIYVEIISIGWQKLSLTRLTNAFALISPFRS